MNDTLVEGQYGHGAVFNKIDLRDLAYKRDHKKIARAAVPFDWEKGWSVEEALINKIKKIGFKIPVKDQGISSSCCGQAGAYYEASQDAVEKGIYTEKSARDAYSQTYYPGGGSSTRAICDLIVNKGICKESLMPSYPVGSYSPDEAFMEQRKDASDITVLDAATSKGTVHAPVSISIDEFALDIRDNYGLIFVIEGANNGTWRSAFPQPPVNGPEWAHCLYACKAKMVNGRKHIGIINSWSEDTGDHGIQWLNEDYFNKKYCRDGRVVYDTPNDALKKQVTLYQKILDLLQRLFLGTNTT